MGRSRKKRNSLNGNPLKYSDPSGNWSTVNGCCNQEEDCYTRLSRPIQPSSGKLSRKGEVFITAYELHFVWPYGDAGFHKGYCTIGYGTVLSYPIINNCSFYDVQKLHDFNVTDQLTGTTKKLNPLKGLSEADIEYYFRREITVVEKAINSSITIKLSQNQFDALVSFLYNAGQNKLTNDLWINNDWVKTTYAALINNHQAKTAFYEMIKQSSYVKSTGKFNRSLYFRRYEEKEMYFYNDYIIDHQNDPEPEDYFK